MFLRFEAMMNGAKFSSIAEEVILRDIVEQPATVDTALSRIAGRPGQRLSAQTRTALSVRLVYNIRSRDIARRSAVRDLVAKWARDGGMLEINSRPGKHLYVVADAAPALDSSLKWTQDLSLTLTAYEQPYWEDNDPTVASFATTYDAAFGYAVGFATLDAPGTAMDATVKSVKVVNADGSKAMTNVTVRLSKSSGIVGAPKRDLKSVMNLTGLDIPPRDGVEIFYSSPGPLYAKPGILYIRQIKTKTDLFWARTPDSSDDLLFAPGSRNQVSAQTNVAATVEVNANGWWL